MPLAAVAPVRVAPEVVLARGGLVLPPARADYLRRSHRVGLVLYTPGVLPYWGDELRHTGRAIDEVPVSIAADAARLCSLNILALARAVVGSLDRVRGARQLNVLVRGEGLDGGYSRIADAASAVFYEVFGEAGRHRREVIATTDVPQGAVVQVSAVLELTPG